MSNLILERTKRNLNKCKNISDLIDIHLDEILSNQFLYSDEDVQNTFVKVFVAIPGSRSTYSWILKKFTISNINTNTLGFVRKIIDAIKDIDSIVYVGDIDFKINILCMSEITELPNLNYPMDSFTTAIIEIFELDIDPLYIAAIYSHVPMEAIVDSFIEINNGGFGSLKPYMSIQLEKNINELKMVYNYMEAILVNDEDMKLNFLIQYNRIYNRENLRRTNVERLSTIFSKRIPNIDQHYFHIDYTCAALDVPDAFKIHEEIYKIIFKNLIYVLYEDTTSFHNHKPSNTTISDIREFLVKIVDMIVPTRYGREFANYIAELIYNLFRDIFEKPTMESYVPMIAETDAQVLEAFNANSKVAAVAYGAHKKYKDAEDTVDNQLKSVLVSMKNFLIGDKKKELIEGKEFSPISLFKKVVGGLAIFSVSKFGFFIVLLTRWATSSKSTIQEKRKLSMEMEAEIEMLNEKIDDAKGAGDNAAKYALMRSKTQLTNALKKIKFGIAIDDKSANGAKQMMQK